MYYTRLFCFLLGWAPVATACTSDVGEDDPPMTEAAVSMRVPVVIQSTEAQARMSPPVFLFWNASTFLTGGEPDLFFVSSPAFTADHYYPTDTVTLATDRTTWYDSGHAYLNDDQTVLVSGFIPVTAAGEDFKHIVLKSDMLGRDSVWIAGEAELGSSYNPFSRALTFVHASTRLIFKAQLAEGMSLPVRNVQVTVHPEGAALYALKWQSYTTSQQLKQCGFVADEDYQPSEADQKLAAQRLTLKTYTGQLPSANWVALNPSLIVTLDTVYVRPGLSRISLDVAAVMGTNQEYQVRNRTISFRQNDTDLTLESGDSYVVTLKFSKDDIYFGGYKVDFEEAGNYYVTASPFVSTQ